MQLILKLAVGFYFVYADINMRIAFKRCFKVVQTPYLLVYSSQLRGACPVSEILLVGYGLVYVTKSVQLLRVAHGILKAGYRVLLLLQLLDLLGIQADGGGLRALRGLQFVLVVLYVVPQLLIARCVGDDFGAAVFVRRRVCGRGAALATFTTAGRAAWVGGVLFLVLFQRSLGVLRLGQGVGVRGLGVPLYVGGLPGSALVLDAEELLHPFPGFLDHLRGFLEGLHQIVPHRARHIFYRRPHFVADIAERLAIVVCLYQNGHQTGYCLDDDDDGDGAQHEVQGHLRHLPCVRGYCHYLRGCCLGKRGNPHGLQAGHHGQQTRAQLRQAGDRKPRVGKQLNVGGRRAGHRARPVHHRLNLVLQHLAYSLTRARHVVEGVVYRTGTVSHGTNVLCELVFLLAGKRA